MTHKTVCILIHSDSINTLYTHTHTHLTHCEQILSIPSKSHCLAIVTLSQHLLSTFPIITPYQSLPINHIIGDLKMQQHFTEFLASCWQISPPAGPVLANETFDVSSWGYKPMPSEEFHMLMWEKICPWGTCGAFTFNVFRDPHSSSFLGINKFNYQVGLILPLPSHLYLPTLSFLTSSFLCFSCLSQSLG